MSTGTARKKEYSAAAFLESPKILPPIIVDADLETPGINAMHCMSPINTAFLIETISKVFACKDSSFLAKYFSTIRIAIPPKSQADPRINSKKSLDLITSKYFLKINPANKTGSEPKAIVR